MMFLLLPVLGLPFADPRLATEWCYSYLFDIYLGINTVAGGKEIAIELESVNAWDQLVGKSFVDRDDYLEDADEVTHVTEILCAMR